MKRILMFDGYNTYIRSFQVIPVTSDNGDHFGGVFGFIRSVKSAIDMFKPDEVVIAWDGPNSGLRRKLMFKEYKAHRRSKPWQRGLVRAFDFLSEQQQSENFLFQLKRIKEYLAMLPVKVISMPYVEADDVIAEIVRLSKDQNIECVIYSSDGDYKQLVNEKVSCYNPISKKLTTADSFLNENGYPAQNFIFVKSIKGDSSDNIPGIKGLGEKTAVKLFNLDSRIYLDIDDLIGECTYILNGETKGYTKSQLAKYKLILDNTDALRRNYCLMQLKDVDISTQSKDVIREFMNLKPNSFDKFRLKYMMVEDHLGSQLKNFDSLARSFAGLQVL